ncbi:MAG TPA: amidohydrolase [Vicinamibacteria bacterium]|nr:amidohydrolase [Vicinamibacteria bacterium]
MPFHLASPSSVPWRTACAVAVAGCVLSPRASAAPAEPAQLVLRGGVVHTLDPARPSAEAVAVRGGRIVAVGTDSEVAALIGPQTRVVELRGRTVIPGFEDSHAHLLGVGYQRLDLDLLGTRSFEEVVGRVAAAVKTRRPGEWIRGRGWHEGRWTTPPADAVRGFPTQAALSAVSPENPVVLSRADGHAVLANARAMALRGITRETRAPAGGEIVRGARGEPTGVFVDNATRLVEPPERSPQERERALELATDECAREGVTTLTDAGATLDDIALYRRAAEEGRLRSRLYVMAAGGETMRALGPPLVGLAGGMLTVRAVKLYADGALGSRGAALLQPYRDDPGNSGLLVTAPETLLETTRQALALGFQVATHAIGDRANRIVLDAYERALAEAGSPQDRRFRVEHAQVLDPADLPRFRRLGVLASFQGIHCPSDRPWAGARLGPERLRGAYAWRSLLASGARLLNGTDAPVEDLSPIQNFHATVTRQDASGQPPGGFDPDQKLTREEALRSMTSEGAYGRFAEADEGALRAGNKADLVVLSQDILTAPDEALMSTAVVLTVVDGRVVHEAKSSPPRPAHQVGQQPPAAGDAGRYLAEEHQAHVGPGALADHRVDEQPPLLARVLREGVGRSQQVPVARVARGQ